MPEAALESDPELSSALAIFSAMITPAVLILACSSLILATSARLSRTLERTRTLLQQFQELTVGGTTPRATIDSTYFMLMEQIALNTHRANLIQLAMALLYTALALFVMTSAFIGIDSLVGQGWSFFVVLLGLIGVCLLLGSALLLIMESRVAFQAVKGEMNFVREVAQLSKGFVPPLSRS